MTHNSFYAVGDRVGDCINGERGAQKSGTLCPLTLGMGKLNKEVDWEQARLVCKE